MNPVTACVTEMNCQLSVFATDGMLVGPASGGSFQVHRTDQNSTCTGMLSGDALTEQCGTQGGARVDVTGTRTIVAGATRMCCDVHAQDCGAGMRCTLVSVTDDATLATTACVPASGSMAQDAMCTRTPTTPGMAMDDCATGQYCARIGQSSGGGRVCRPLCTADADCGAGQICHNAGTVPLAGWCLTQCDIFNPTCPGGLGCALQGNIPTPNIADFSTACIALGSGQLGAACTVIADCASGLCFNFGTGSGSVCAAPCDTMHPCAAGATCVTPSNASAVHPLGACQPM
jgi:Cys-rich repeat protein